MDTSPIHVKEAAGDPAAAGTSRRRFLGYLLAAPTLVAAAEILDALAPATAAAVIPSPPEPADEYDLGDLQVNAAMPTWALITVTVNNDGTASFALPRAEVGQGITTTFAMLIADELDLPIDRVHISLEKARPELTGNQLTGGSNSVRSLYTPVRTAAAIARQRLVTVAAERWGVSPDQLRVAGGVISGPGGRKASYGDLAEAAAATRTVGVHDVQLKPAAQQKLVGKPHNRIDAHDIVTGRKVFAMDLDIPGAMPAMVCRPPTINGTVKRVHNRAQVLKMPGITHVVMIPTGVAVRGRTFGECIDAVRALKVSWGPGTAEGKSDASIEKELVAAELPMATQALPGQQLIDRRFTFYFASNSPLETGCAVARVTKTSAEVWGSLKVPIVAQQLIADATGLPLDAVTVHVTQGGGSFGRHLFADVAIEAARIAQKCKAPVKLMWHRTDDFRQGRVHPMSTSRIRAVWSGRNVVSLEQRHTSVDTDFRHGLGDLVSSYLATLPEGNELGYAQGIFNLTQTVPYNFGVTEQALWEVDGGFNTGSMRNIYSPDVATALELVVDELAAKMGMDRYRFRRKFVKNARTLAVLDRAAKEGKWGRKLPAHMAQGIAVHEEYKGTTAAVVEIDCRPQTVHRKIRDAYTGPRVTRVTFVVDVGLPLNPKGLEAQMLGGINDGIALALTSSLHLKDGYFLEGSWDNYYYTREWNTPPEVKVIVMPPTTGKPGGAGELGVAATKAAVACAYAHATGSMPTFFPVNHHKPLGFEPLPTVPPIPQSPTDGLDYAY